MKWLEYGSFFSELSVYWKLKKLSLKTYLFSSPLLNIVLYKLAKNYYKKWATEISNSSYLYCSKKKGENTSHKIIET